MDRFISEMAAVANEVEINCIRDKIGCLIYERKQELHRVKNVKSKIPIK